MPARLEPPIALQMCRVCRCQGWRPPTPWDSPHRGWELGSHQRRNTSIRSQGPHARIRGLDLERDRDALNLRSYIYIYGYRISALSPLVALNHASISALSLVFSYPVSQSQREDAIRLGRACHLSPLTNINFRFNHSRGSEPKNKFRTHVARPVSSFRMEVCRRIRSVRRLSQNDFVWEILAFEGASPIPFLPEH